MKDEQNGIVPGFSLSFALLIDVVLVLVQIVLPNWVCVKKTHVPGSPNVDDEDHHLDHQISDVHHLGDQLVRKDVL
jgi:hypothetical protein